MKSIGVGVIGVGAIGRLHSENYATKVPGASLVGIADVNTTASTFGSARSCL